MSDDHMASISGRTVVVTGGLGFVGSAVVRAALSQGAMVRVLDSLLPNFGGSPRHLQGVSGSVEVAIDDVRAREAVNRLVRGADIIVHLAGAGGPSTMPIDWTTEIDISCLGVLNVLDAARVYAPTARIVFASSAAVYGKASNMLADERTQPEPLSLFAVHKLTGESYCGLYRSAYGLDCTVARIAETFGPRQRHRGCPAGTVAAMLDAALHDDALPVDASRNVPMDILFIDDLAQMILRLAALPGQPPAVMNLGSGCTLEMAEVADAVVAACGTGRVRKLSRTTLSSVPPMNVLMARDLGVWVPPTAFAEALERTVAWYRGETNAA